MPCKPGMACGTAVSRESTLRAAVLPEGRHRQSNRHHDGCSPALHRSILRPIRFVDLSHIFDVAAGWLRSQDRQSWADQNCCRRIALPPRRRQSDAPIVRAPAPDLFLDLLAVQIALESQFGEFNNLVVAGKTQGNQLLLAEPVDLRMPFLRGQCL